MSPRLAGLLVFTLTLLLYAMTLAPGPVDNGDSGEFLAAAAGYGVPHPSGYPTYMLLAGSFYRLPLFGFTPFERVGLLSALAAALAAAMLCEFQRRTGVPWAVAAVCALGLALNPLVWSQAVMAEVYTLHVFFFVGVLWLAWHFAAPAPRWHWLAAGWWCGAGLGNHVTLLFIVPVLWYRAWRASARWRALLFLTGGLALGLMVYAYLPQAAARQPYLNWGDPSSLSRFLDHVTLAQFRGDAWQWSRLPLKLAVLGETLVGMLGIPALALAVFGCAAAWRDAARRPVLLAVLLYGALVVCAFGQGQASVLAASMPAHLIPVIAAGALLAGWGWAALRAPRLREIMLAALALWLLLQAPMAWRNSTRRDNHILTNFAARLLESCPERGLLLVEQDDVTFPLWAVQAAGLRRDVLVVNGTLLHFPWYREQLARRAGVPVTDDPRAMFAALAEPAPAVYAYPAAAPYLGLRPVAEKGLFAIIKPDRAHAAAETNRIVGMLATVEPHEFALPQLTAMERSVQDDYVSAFNNLAVQWARVGEPRRGLFYLRRALDLQPGNRELQRNELQMRRAATVPAARRR